MWRDVGNKCLVTFHLVNVLLVFQEKSPQGFQPQYPETFSSHLKNTFSWYDLWTTAAK